MYTLKRTIIICASSLAIIGCLAIARNTSAIVPTGSAAQTSTATAVVPTGSPTLSTCAVQAGKLNDVELPLKKDKPPLAVKVYTPPCFEQKTGQKYPLLILLHGQSSTNDSWVNLGVPAILDDLYRSDPSTAVVVAFPQEQNSHGDQDESPYESQLVDTLIPWLRSNYPLETEPRFYAVAGISRGGGWSFRLGVDHPEIFGSVAAHSPAIDGRDYYKLTEFRRSHKTAELPRFYLDIGFDDSLKDSARKVELRLGELRIPHEWHMNSGTHNQEYWLAHIREYLIWYVDAWKVNPTAQ